MIAETAEVTLQAVLLNREERVRRQSAALRAFGRPLLSITLVNPGPVKDSPPARRIMAHALRAAEDLMTDRDWPVLSREVHWEDTGPEALLAVGAGAYELKRAATRLEEEHPLGRLWDLDVIDPSQGTISRIALGLDARRCLLCAEEAHVCVRSKAHTVHKLQNAIREVLDAYREP